MQENRWFIVVIAGLGLLVLVWLASAMLDGAHDTTTTEPTPVPPPVTTPAPTPAPEPTPPPEPPAAEQLPVVPPPHVEHHDDAPPLPSHEPPEAQQLPVVPEKPEPTPLPTQPLPNGGDDDANSPP